jgi:hypothetical protein
MLVGSNIDNARDSLFRNVCETIVNSALNGFPEQTGANEKAD